MEILGNRLQEYTLSTGEILKQCAFGILGVGLTVFMIVTAISLTESSLSRCIIIGGAMLFLFLGGYCLALIFSALRLWWQNPTVALYEHGVSRISQRPRYQRQDWHWNDFTEMKGLILDYKLFGMSLSKGGSWTFTSETVKPAFTVSSLYRQSIALCELVILQVTAVLFPQYLAKFQSGQPLTFGKITLDQRGINNGKQSIAWVDIQGLQMSGQYLYIAQRLSPQRIQVNMEGVPNVPLMLRLIDHQIRAQN